MREFFKRKYTNFFCLVVETGQIANLHRPFVCEFFQTRSTDKLARRAVFRQSFAEISRNGWRKIFRSAKSLGYLAERKVFTV